MEFPFPQRLGRTRPIQLFRRDFNFGMPARPTGSEAASMATQKPNYINNWLGNIGIAYREKKFQSEYKASKIGGASPTFQTIADKFDKISQKTQSFLTMADKLLVNLGLKEQSSYPSGEMNVNAPQTKTTDYTAANKINQHVTSDVTPATQPKGFFNLAYLNPAVAGSSTNESAQQAQVFNIMNLWPILLIGGLIWVTK